MQLAPNMNSFFCSRSKVKGLVAVAYGSLSIYLNWRRETISPVDLFIPKNLLKMTRKETEKGC